MACIHMGWNSPCQFYEEDMGNVKNIHDTDYGFVGYGDCVVEDDEYPSDTCSAYESNDPTEDEEEDEESEEELVAFHEHIDKLQKDKIC